MFRLLTTDEGGADLSALAETVKRARKGDPEALRTLYEEHYRRIFHLVYRMVHRREEAIDLTAEAFLKAFSNLKRLKTDEAFGAWLRKVATNLCLDYIKRKTLPTLSLETLASSEEGERAPVEPADTGRGPERDLVTKELGERVQEALDMLSPVHRSVILLHHVDGRQVKEIAEIMDCSEGTVKSRLGRARENLRRILQEYLE